MYSSVSNETYSFDVALNAPISCALVWYDGPFDCIVTRNDSAMHKLAKVWDSEITIIDEDI